MIKLIAALTMLIDHIGVIFFPEVLIFRVIGRLSMPLYAYCIARGFYYSRQHGTVRKYIVNMLIFALLSQLPFYLMSNNGYNIGFTWLFSLLLLMVATANRFKPFVRVLLFSAVGAVLVALELSGWFSVDYGFCGIVTPLLFYVLIHMKREHTMNYVLVILLGWACYVLVQQGALAQIISALSAFVVTVSKKHDRKIKLPKWVFYSFYPMHIVILLIIRYLIT